MSTNASQSEKIIRPNKGYILVDEDIIDMVEITHERIDLNERENTFITKLKKDIDNSSGELRISNKMYNYLRGIAE